MQSTRVTVDQFGVETVFLRIEDLEDFQECIKYVVEKKIGDDKGIFKIRLINGFNTEYTANVVTTVKAMLLSRSPHWYGSFGSSSIPDDVPHHQLFHKLSDDNIFLYRLRQSAVSDVETFVEDFKNLSVYDKKSTCCAEKLKSGRRHLLDHYWSALENCEDGMMCSTKLAITCKNRTHSIYGTGFCLSGLNTCLNLISEQYSGICWPYLYLGDTHATFAWHVEDGALWSISYLHFGSSKIWFAVPARYYGALDTLMYRLGIPQAHKMCRNLLGHKCFVIDPFFLLQNGIPATMVIQEEGEFVVTRPFAAHAGFDMGKNVVETANFASPDWIPLGMIAPTCMCYSGMRKLDITPIIMKHCPELVACYQSGNWYKCSPLASDPFSCLPFVKPASASGILGCSQESIQLLRGMQEEQSHFFDSFAERKLVLECPACPKTYSGGPPKIYRLLQHASKFHLQSNPTIISKIKKKYGTRKKYKTIRGKSCNRCLKFIRGSSTHLHKHLQVCKI